MLKAKVRKTKYGFKGFVECWDGFEGEEKKIWSETAYGPVRVTKDDALEDARIHAEWRKA